MSTSTKSFLTPSEKYDRVVVLIDMDAFYCQVEEYLDFERLKGKPIAVVQYTENSGIIAVNYPAKALGVTRHMRENEAKSVCPSLICVKVPSKNGKADLTKYRDAGIRVAKVLQTFTPLLERASVDEAYLDITDLVEEKLQQLQKRIFQFKPTDFLNSFAVGYDSMGTFISDVTKSADQPNDEQIPECDRASYGSSKLRLLIGASIVNQIRISVKQQTNYECSAGIAHNKILAKLCCAFNKPNKQTLVPIDSIAALFKDLPVSKVKSLGGKLGEEICQKLNVKTMGDLLNFSELQLQSQFQARIGSWLYWMARGIDLEKVVPKFKSKSIAVSKNFRGKSEITSIHTLKYWLKELAKEVVERLQKDENEYKRVSKHMTVTFHQADPGRATKIITSSRTIPLNGAIVNTFTAEQIAELTLDTIKRNTAKFLKCDNGAIMNASIRQLGINVGKFEDNEGEGEEGGSTSRNLQDLFTNHKKRKIEDVDLPTNVATPKRFSTEKREFFSPDNNANNSKAIEEPSPTSSIKSIEDIKQFEMKSPKPVMKASTNILENIVRKRPAESDANKKEEAFNTLKEIVKFGVGEFSLDGVETFQYWIRETTKLLDEKIRKYSLEYSRSPNCINVQVFHVDKRKQPIQVKIDLSAIDDQPLDIIKLLETSELKDYLSTKIENPISEIQISADDFVQDKCWDLEFKWKPLKNYEKKKQVNEIQKYFTKKDQTGTGKEVKVEAKSEDILNINENISTEINSTPSLSPPYSPPSSPFEGIIEKDLSGEIKEIESSTVLKQETPTCSTYVTTYAEFQGPNIKVEELDEEETCPECGRKVSKYDMLEHLDHHLAMALSRKQRQEFQESRKKSLPSTSQAKKKTQITSKSKTKPPNVQSINKFVYKIEESTQASENDSNMVKCEKCQKMISIEESQSHSDYHIAKSLAAQLSKEEGKMNEGSNQTSTKLSQTQKKSSQKSSNKSTSSSAKPNQKNSLTNFFQPK